MDLHRVREHTHMFFSCVYSWGIHLLQIIFQFLLQNECSILPYLPQFLWHGAAPEAGWDCTTCSFPPSTSTTNMSLRQALSVPPFSVCTLACWWECDCSMMHEHQSPGKPLPSQQYSTSPRGYRRSTRTSLSKWDSGKFLCGTQRVNPVRISKASSPCFDAFLVPASY